jgi:hypothetical protein
MLHACVSMRSPEKHRFMPTLVVEHDTRQIVFARPLEKLPGVKPARLGKLSNLRIYLDQIPPIWCMALFPRIRPFSFRA